MRPAAATLRRNVGWASGLLVAIALALIIGGLATPVYHDAEAARALIANACTEARTADGWYEQMDRLRTRRYPLLQTGLSILLALSTAFGLLYRYGHAGRAISTPTEPGMFILLGWFVLLNGWLAQLTSLGVDLERNEFPWCADTIAIPAFGLTALFAVLAAILTLVGVLLLTRFGRLPVALAIRRPDRPRACILHTLGAGILTLLVVVLAVELARSSAFLATPGAVVAVYLILSTRAALLSRGLPQEE